jgi:hypothetical protein
MSDAVNHPKHYNQYPIECIKIVRHMNFNRGNAIKYLWRCNDKNALIQDLQKAIFYLEDEKKNKKSYKKWLNSYLFSEQYVDVVGYALDLFEHNKILTGFVLAISTARRKRDFDFIISEIQKMIEVKNNE